MNTHIAQAMQVPPDRNPVYRRPTVDPASPAIQRANRPGADSGAAAAHAGAVPATLRRIRLRPPWTPRQAEQAKGVASSRPSGSSCTSSSSRCSSAASRPGRRGLHAASGRPRRAAIVSRAAPRRGRYRRPAPPRHRRSAHPGWRRRWRQAAGCVEHHGVVRGGDRVEHMLHSHPAGQLRRLRRQRAASQHVPPLKLGRPRHRPDLAVAEHEVRDVGLAGSRNIVRSRVVRRSQSSGSARACCANGARRFAPRCTCALRGVGVRHHDALPACVACANMQVRAQRAEGLATHRTLIGNKGELTPHLDVASHGRRIALVQHHRLVGQRAEQAMNGTTCGRNVPRCSRNRLLHLLHPRLHSAGDPPGTHRLVETLRHGVGRHPAQPLADGRAIHLE